MHCPTPSATSGAGLKMAWRFNSVTSPLGATTMFSRKPHLAEHNCSLHSTSPHFYMYFAWMHEAALFATVLSSFAY